MQWMANKNGVLNNNTSMKAKAKKELDNKILFKEYKSI